VNIEKDWKDDSPNKSRICTEERVSVFLNDKKMSISDENINDKSEVSDKSFKSDQSEKDDEEKRPDIQ